MSLLKFYMETTRSVVASSHQADFLAAVDIKDMHLHGLLFQLIWGPYQLMPLPCFLLSAAWVFTKVLALLHSCSIPIVANI